MKKLSFIGLAAMTILFGACTNSEPFDPNGGGSSTDYIQPAGQGTESDPYNVSAALVHNMDSSEVWVKGYIVGQVMKASKGKANPSIAKELILKKLETI